MSDEPKVWRGWAFNASENPIQPPNLYLKKSSATGAASINNTTCYEVILLPAADYDALVAERDALRARLAEVERERDKAHGTLDSLRNSGFTRYIMPDGGV